MQQLRSLTQITSAGNLKISWTPPYNELETVLASLQSFSLFYCNGVASRRQSVLQTVNSSAEDKCRDFFSPKHSRAGEGPALRKKLVAW